MRAGDIVLTPPGNAMYGGVPALVVATSEKAISVWTGRWALAYEKKDLSPYGKIRRIKTYKTRTGNEFAQFDVFIGGHHDITDVKMSLFLFKIEDLRKMAFLQALEKMK